jgi:hypothetical protein
MSVPRIVCAQMPDLALSLATTPSGDERAVKRSQDAYQVLPHHHVAHRPRDSPRS